MADQALDPAPVWDELESFDGRAWRGRVDLGCAGFPCQPFSVTGRGGGVDDER
jgi:DNA (cytosine-5)-methyltransferase 1